MADAKLAHERTTELAALLVLLEVATEDPADERGWAVAEGVRAARRLCTGVREALDGEST